MPSINYNDLCQMSVKQSYIVILIVIAIHNVIPIVIETIRITVGIRIE
jgi:hypothetical protein